MSEDSHLLTFSRNQVQLLFLSGVAKRSRIALVVYPCSPTLAWSSITSLSSATWKATPDYLAVRGKRQEIRVRWSQDLSQASNRSSHAMKAPRSVATPQHQRAKRSTEHLPEILRLLRPTRITCQIVSGKHLRGPDISAVSFESWQEIA